jgi:hypothetical protein
LLFPDFTLRFIKNFNLVNFWNLQGILLCIHHEQIIFLTGVAFDEQDEPSSPISDGIAYSTSTVRSACSCSSSTTTTAFYGRETSFG